MSSPPAARPRAHIPAWRYRQGRRGRGRDECRHRGRPTNQRVRECEACAHEVMGRRIILRCDDAWGRVSSWVSPRSSPPSAVQHLPRGCTCRAKEGIATSQRRLKIGRNRYLDSSFGYWPRGTTTARGPCVKPGGTMPGTIPTRRRSSFVTLLQPAEFPASPFLVRIRRTRVSRRPMGITIRQ